LPRSRNCTACTERYIRCSVAAVTNRGHRSLASFRSATDRGAPRWRRGTRSVLAGSVRIPDTSAGRRWRVTQWSPRGC
jgi:hypothetical protein